jgi:hypothetical protein
VDRGEVEVLVVQLMDLVLKQEVVVQVEGLFLLPLVILEETGIITVVMLDKVKDVEEEEMEEIVMFSLVHLSW